MNKKAVILIGSLIVLIFLGLATWYINHNPKNTSEAAQIAVPFGSHESGAQNSQANLANDPRYKDYRTEPVPPSSDFSVFLTDAFGTEIANDSVITVDDSSYITNYDLHFPNLGQLESGESYTLWLQTDEGARTLLGQLEVAEGVGVYQAAGSRVKAGWSILVIYENSANEENLIYRGRLIPKP